MGMALMAVLSACPSREANPAGTFQDAGAEAGDAADSDVTDARVVVDVSEDLSLTCTFTAGGIRGANGGVSVQANIQWHGNLRGNNAGITFEGAFR